MSAPAPHAPQIGSREYGLIGLQSMLWGSAFFFVAVVGNEVQPLTMTALRLVPACLVLLGVIGWMGLRLPATLADWVRMLLLAAFNNVIPFVLIVHAQRDVTGGVAAIFNATAPLFAVFIASRFVPEERLAAHRVAGIAVGIGGVAVLVGGGGAVSPWAAGLLLAAACCYASGNVMTRLFFAGHPPFVIATAHMLMSLLLAGLAASLIEQPWTAPAPSSRAFVAIMGMGVFASALASLCHFTILRRAGPTNALLVTILLPLTPIVLGALLLGESIAMRHIVGGLIVALALVILDGRLWRRLATRRKPHLA